MSNPQDNRPVVFGRRAADRIKRAVIRSERTPYYPDFSKNQGPKPWTFGVLEAIVTTAITAASGTTYGTGYAQVYIDNGSGTGITDTLFSSPVTVLNWSVNSGTIAIGAHIGICWRNNGWRLVWADC